MRVAFKMTQERAQELGLIVCVCGHMSNNHFEQAPRVCAHCDCKALNLIPIHGLTLAGGRLTP